jgi:hypothetical protein
MKVNDSSSYMLLELNLNYYLLLLLLLLFKWGYFIIYDVF